MDSASLGARLKRSVVTLWYNLMAAQATLVLKNGSNVDTNHVVFNQTPGNPVAFWADKSAGSMAGYRIASLSAVLPRNRENGTARITAKYVLPVLDGATGLVKYTLYFDATARIPAQATEAERQELEFRASSFMNHSVFKTDGIRNLDMPY
ncbi:TPA_asm: coat protein [ssRNA phage SRR5466338_3]|uniref:Coat protein n=1 Tax=ssRNA phage SRR5466338_3 TaxID=2786392 RepID=A0A8S5L108_9VIRU|nr:coat protein [ssRNA phage SRR5466338_3]DAD50786.1 TPA_asm: coat protein [ssRNA phage SRR5466338_3]